jgi:hypothetical protein
MTARTGRRHRGAIWGRSGIGSSPERLLHGSGPGAEVGLEAHPRGFSTAVVDGS